MDTSIFQKLSNGDISVDKIESVLDESFFGSTSTSKEHLKAAPSSNCTHVWKHSELAFACATCEDDPTAALCFSCFLAGDHSNHSWRLLRVNAGRCDCGSSSINHKTGKSLTCKFHPTPITSTSTSTSLPSGFPSPLEFFSAVLEFINNRVEAFSFTSPFGEDPVLEVVSTWTREVADLHEGFRYHLASLLSPSNVSSYLLASIHPSKAGHSISDLLYSFLSVVEFRSLLLEVYSSNYVSLAEKVIFIKQNIDEYNDKLFGNFGVQLFTIADLVPSINGKLNGQMMVSLFSAFNLVLNVSKNNYIPFSGLISAIGGDLIFTLNYPQIRSFITHNYSQFTSIFSDLISLYKHEHRAFEYKRRGKSDEFYDDPVVPSPEWSRSITVQFLVFNIISKLVGELEDSIDKIAESTPESLELMKLLARIIINVIPQATSNSVLNEKVSLHYPLHRLLAFLVKIISASEEFNPLDYANVEFWLSQTIPISEAFAFSSFVNAQLFKKNGLHPYLEVKERPTSFSLFRDYDLFFLQICASVAITNQKIDKFIEILANSYSVWTNQVFNLSLPLDDNIERHTSTAFDFFCLIYRIIVERFGCTSLLGIVKQDLIHQLASKDKPFSQLIRHLTFFDSSKFDLINDLLSDVAVFREPTEVSSGYYILKSIIWEKVDLFYPHLTAEKIENLTQRSADTRVKIMMRPGDLDDHFSYLNCLSCILNSNVLNGLIWCSVYSSFSRSNQVNKPLELGIRLLYLSICEEFKRKSISDATGIIENFSDIHADIPTDPNSDPFDTLKYCYTKFPIPNQSQMSLIDLMAGLGQKTHASLLLPLIKQFLIVAAPHVINETSSTGPSNAKKRQAAILAHMQRQQAMALELLSGEISEEEEPLADQKAHLENISSLNIGCIDLSNSVCAYCRQQVSDQDSSGFFCHVTRTAQLDYLLREERGPKLPKVEQLLNTPINTVSDLPAYDSDSEMEGEDQMSANEGDVDMEEVEYDWGEGDDVMDDVEVVYEDGQSFEEEQYSSSSEPNDDALPMDIIERVFGRFIQSHQSQQPPVRPLGSGDGRFGAKVSGCGHLIHTRCFLAFSETLDQQEDHSLNPECSEFRCPLCRTLCNAVVPLMGHYHCTSAHFTLSVGTLSGESLVRRGLEILDDPIELITGNSVEVVGTDALAFNSFISHVIANNEGVCFKSIEFGTPPTREISAFNIASSLSHSLSSLEIRARSGNGMLCDSASFKVLKAVLRSILVQMKSSGFRYSDIKAKFFADDGNLSLNCHFQFPLVMLILTGCCSLESFSSVLSISFMIAAARAVLAAQLYGNCVSSDYTTPSHGSFEFLVGQAFSGFSAEILNQNHSLPSFDKILYFLVPFIRRAWLLYHVAFKNEPPAEVFEGDIVTYFAHLMSNSSLMFGVNNQSFLYEFPRFYRILGIQSKFSGQFAIAPCLPFSIVSLPSYFHILYFQSRKVSCGDCGEVPQSPALCLSCGKVVCMGNKRSMLPEVELLAGELWKHCYLCTGGFGAFLLLNTCNVQYLDHGRVADGVPIYLDPHGESDAHLARGLPLMLNELRIKSLEKQIGGNSFIVDTDRLEFDDEFNL
ncbi:hypothetical protein P9112_000167 [Eukaryota sp. TZLM1-RC]